MSLKKSFSKSLAVFPFFCVEINVFFQTRRLLEGQDAMDFGKFHSKIEVQF